jgi:Fe-S-cluster containining protein
VNRFDTKTLREVLQQVPPAVLERLCALFERIDAAYAQTAGQCNFECRGCDESCCRTRFYHHTLLEMAYLKEGLAVLPAAERDAVVEGARAQIDQMRHCEADGKSPRAMCPLNVEGRCRLYPQRPMICRLHGVAHRLRRGDGTFQQAPGCHRFAQQCPDPGPALLDRTPHYQQMAALEQSLRRTLYFEGRIKFTVAEMVLMLCDGADNDIPTHENH